MTIRKVTAAAALCAVVAAAAPQGAKAQDAGQNYLSIGAGANWFKDSDVVGNGVNNTIDFDMGWGLTGAVGHKYGKNLRLELELGHRTAEVDSITGTGSASGDVDVTSLMANIYYDFATQTAVTPYLGLGVGGARIKADNVRTLGASSTSDDDNVFAYQGIAGLSYPVAEQLSLFGEYRHFAAADPNFNLADGTRVEADFADHRVMVGLRWAFGGPKPAMAAEPMAKPVAAAAPKPAPAPKPEPVQVARDYLVFFDWDKSDIRTDAAAILKEAAANYPKAKAIRIRATGHADRSGPAAYNVGLSKRRAEAVKAELVRLGVPVGDIAVAWKGETDPLVPTADGVREPQNRRVEIVFE